MNVGGGQILVVDDNRMNRIMLTRSLEQQGHQVTSADHGRLALELLRSQAFELVLLDIVMPEMDGYQVLAEIKGDEQLHGVPVLMISALDETENVVRCLEVGAEDFLPKPFDPMLLRARVESALEKKRLRQQVSGLMGCAASLAEAASHISSGTFDPTTLDDLTSREDECGQLARTLQQLAQTINLSK
jgi:two-component system cell cycle response regulator